MYCIFYLFSNVGNTYGPIQRSITNGGVPLPIQKKSCKTRLPTTERQSFIGWRRIFPFTSPLHSHSWCHSHPKKEEGKTCARGIGWRGFKYIFSPFPVGRLGKGKWVGGRTFDCQSARGILAAGRLKDSSSSFWVADFTTSTAVFTNKRGG